MTGLHPWWPAWIPIHPHPLFEALAYLVAWRLLVRDRARGDVLSDPMTRAVLLTAGVVGAAALAKAVCLLDDPARTLADPIGVLEGKSIVGALVGGVLAVEVGKWALGVPVATGDLYVRPLWIGIAIGRVGCFLSGVTDATHGLPTPLPWGMDLGDGVPRHPTALYEIGFLVALGLVLDRIRWTRVGDKFAVFLVAYLTWRVAVETLKPVLHPYAGLSGLQLVALVGALGFGVRVLTRTPLSALSSSWPRPPPGS